MPVPLCKLAARKPNMTKMPMTTMQGWRTALATLLAGALLLTGCGGGADRTKAQLRLVNASAGYSSLDLRVQGALRQGAVAYGASDSYVEVDPKEADTTITSASSPTALLSLTPALEKNKRYSVLAYGAQGALRQLLLDENTNAPDTNRSLLRVVNAAPDAGALDIYITGADDTLAASVPVQSAAAFGTLGSFLTLTSGSWRLRITAAGSKTDVRLNLSPLALASKQITTLVLTPARGGVLVNALLVNQNSGIGRLDSTQARVRVAAGVTNAAAVVAKVGGITVLDGNAAVISAYTLLAGGTQPVAVTVNAAAVTAPDKTLDAGGDYTLLVYGPASAPLLGWIEDGIRLPSDTSQARLRLVNGVAGNVPLSMTVNLLPVVTGTVATGTASSYAEITPVSGATLSVTASGQTTPIYSAADQTFVAGATYSVFVLGDPTAAVGTVRKDR